MLNDKEREFLTLWLISHGQSEVLFLSAGPAYLMYMSVDGSVIRDLYDFVVTDYLVETMTPIGTRYALTPKAIKELQDANI
jgi:hypothetical protein